MCVCVCVCVSVLACVQRKNQKKEGKKKVGREG